MGFMNWLTEKVVGKKPEISMRAHPLTINPTHDEQIERIKIRLQRCIESRDNNPDVGYKARMDIAIKRHKAALVAAGVLDNLED